MTSLLDDVYDKYKHLDGCLSDPEWCTSGEGAAIYAIAGELWRAVKEERSRQSEQPSTAIEDITPEGAAIIQQAKAQATAAENKRVLEGIEYGISAYEKEHKNQQVKDECCGIYIPINVVRRLMEVRRLAQPEPKEREPE